MNLKYATPDTLAQPILAQVVMSPHLFAQAKVARVVSRQPLDVIEYNHFSEIIKRTIKNYRLPKNFSPCILYEKDGHFLYFVVESMFTFIDSYVDTSQVSRFHRDILKLPSPKQLMRYTDTELHQMTLLAINSFDDMMNNYSQRVIAAYDYAVAFFIWLKP